MLKPPQRQIHNYMNFSGSIIMELLLFCLFSILFPPFVCLFVCFSFLSDRLIKCVATTLLYLCILASPNTDTRHFFFFFFFFFSNSYKRIRPFLSFPKVNAAMMNGSSVSFFFSNIVPERKFCDELSSPDDGIDDVLKLNCDDGGIFG